MITSQKKQTALFFIGLILVTSSVYSQTKSDFSIYNWYDNVAGKGNLDFNTGKIYTNPYKSIDKSTLFLKSDSFEIGTLNYDGNLYFEIPLKYDILRDILVLNPSEGLAVTAISLNQDKVDSFLIFNKNFVKINKEQYNNTNFSTGYYEIVKYSENQAFYIKHSKSLEKRVKDDGIYYSFKDNNTFYFDLDKKLYAINSKKDIIKLFPSKKEEINNFYASNNTIRKTDFDQFMKNLLQSVTTSLFNKEQ